MTHSAEPQSNVQHPGQLSGQPFDLAAMSCRLIGELEAFAAAKGVGLVVVVAPSTMALFKGDADRFSVAFSCLVRHAIGRAQGGYVRIYLKIVPKSQKLVVQVTDNGGQFQKAPTLDLLLGRCIAHFLRGHVRCCYSATKGAATRLYLPFPRVQRPRLNGLRHTKRAQCAA